MLAETQTDDDLAFDTLFRVVEEPNEDSGTRLKILENYILFSCVSKACRGEERGRTMG